MATKTLGTNATTTLTAIPWKNGIGSGVSAADYATITQLITANNGINSYSAIHNRLSPEGVLYLPQERGFIKVQPGDWIGVDDQGWPIVVSAYSIAHGAWTHS